MPALILAALLIVAGGVLALKNHQESERINNPIITATSPSSSTNSDRAVANSPSSSKGDATSNATSTESPKYSSPNSVLNQPPSGAFVSNHRPNLSGSPAPSSEQSVCNTVPGASCYIQFTKDGLTKTLPTKVADASGSIIWAWDVKESGFVDGSWHISAVASLNGKSFSSTDSDYLEVMP